MSTVNINEYIAEENNTSKEVVIIEKPLPKAGKKKSRAFTEKETLLLISEWFKYPQLYDKKTSEYHDRDKRVIARQQMASSLNQAMGYEDNEEKQITGTYSLVFIYIIYSNTV